MTSEISFKARFWHEQRRMIVSSVQGWVSRAEMPVPKNGLDALWLANCSWFDHLTLMDWRHVLTS